MIASQRYGPSVYDNDEDNGDQDTMDDNATLAPPTALTIRTTSKPLDEDVQWEKSTRI